MLLVLCALLAVAGAEGDEVVIASNQSEANEKIQQCFAAAAVARDAPRQITKVEHAHTNPYVLLHSLVDQIDMNNIDLLSKCVAEHRPELIHDRRFGQG